MFHFFSVTGLSHRMSESAGIVINERIYDKFYNVKILLQYILVHIFQSIFIILCTYMEFEDNYLIL